MVTKVSIKREGCDVTDKRIPSIARGFIFLKQALCGRLTAPTPHVIPRKLYARVVAECTAFINQPQNQAREVETYGLLFSYMYLAGMRFDNATSQC